MNKFFEDALKSGFIEPVLLSDKTHFEVDGIKYYQPTESGSKMSIARFHSALDIIRMHEELKLSYQQNKGGWDRVKELAGRIATSPDIEDIREAALDIMDIQRRIDSRMQFGKDIEQVYQLAAIYFLSENENPAEINQAHINDKIKSFKARPELYAFFLSLPLSGFLGSSTVSDIATLSFLKEIQLQEILDLKYFLIKSQIYGSQNDTTNFISSRMETLEESLILANSLLSNTTTPSLV